MDLQSLLKRQKDCLDLGCQRRGRAEKLRNLQGSGFLGICFDWAAQVAHSRHPCRPSAANLVARSGRFPCHERPLPNDHKAPGEGRAATRLPRPPALLPLRAGSHSTLSRGQQCPSHDPPAAAAA